MNIILIGMPASGKSCMGRALAKHMNMKNIDADRVIESVDGRPLQEIINTDGLAAFNSLEEKVLLSINGENIIISTGGSAVYYEKAMEHFKNIGIVVYLYASLETIKKRLGDFSKRGIVLRPGQTIEELYNERCVLYEKYADITINCDGNAYTSYRIKTINAVKKHPKAKQKSF